MIEEVGKEKVEEISKMIIYGLYQIWKKYLKGEPLCDRTAFALGTHFYVKYGIHNDFLKKGITGYQLFFLKFTKKTIDDLADISTLIMKEFVLWQMLLK